MDHDLWKTLLLLLVPALAWLERQLPRTCFSKVFLVAVKTPE